MNHDAKYSGGIFHRRPSTASANSRLFVQSSRSGSISCPTSPRHSRHLPAISSSSLPSTYLNDVLTATAANARDVTPARLFRSPSASSHYNYRQNSNLYSYTGKIFRTSFKNAKFYPIRILARSCASVRRSMVRASTILGSL